MENDISTGLDQLVIQEKALAKEIDDREFDADRALSELHESLSKLHALRQGEKQTLLAVNDYIAVVKENMLKVGISDLSGQRNEIVGLLDNISWSIRSVLDKIERFEKELKKD